MKVLIAEVDGSGPKDLGTFEMAQVPRVGEQMRIGHGETLKVSRVVWVVAEPALDAYVEVY